MSAAIKIEKVNYKGWANSWKVSNGEIELVVTGDIGPRIISIGFVGGQNLFKNYPEQMGKSGESEWMIRGGSRIWFGPEDAKATYALDNVPVDIRIDGNTLIATEPVEESVKLVKQMVIRMAPSGTSIEVVHRIQNVSLMPTEFAAWILTVMTPGGVGITGFPPRGTHPEVLPPSNPLVMWAFTDLSDKRWIYTNKYLMLKMDPAAKAPQKIGHFNKKTWGAYYLNNELFIKRYDADPTKIYPDFGCSYETFTNSDMLEMETMGPLQKVAPGQWIEHVERWSLHKNVKIGSWTDQELDRVLLPLL